MSTAQIRAVETMLREGPLDLGGDLALQRPLLDELMTSHPLPAGVNVHDDRVGGVPVVRITPQNAADGRLVLYLHGGGYALGSARAGAGLAAELARRSGADAVSVDYRLAPEHPFPAALDDACAVYAALVAGGFATDGIVLAGESAGGGLALALLLAIRERGLSMPAAAVVFSPWADLTCSGPSLRTKAALDPALTPEALHIRAADYAAGADPALPGLSPIFGRFDGLPPLLVQVGTHEILLDDALRVAAAAARDDVEVTLQVTPNVPHVFQGFFADVDEADDALDRAATFVADRLTPKSKD